MVDGNIHKHKPVILVTHSRACSTALERAFWTRPGEIRCFHEHFGDAFYFGPDEVADRYTKWPEDRVPKAGRSETTYRSALRDILQLDSKDPCRYVFNKDIAHHLVPPKDSLISEIPSLKGWDDDETGMSTPAPKSTGPNPTWLPTSAVESLQFAFLIRSPWLAVPSLYRLCVPPLNHVTKVEHFRSDKIGYRELRILVEHLYPHVCGDKREDGVTNGNSATEPGPILIEASDLLANPEATLRQFCSRVNLPFSPSMLHWAPHNPEMEKAFSKFPGFHTDAMSSSGFRRQAKTDPDSGRKSDEEYMAQWTEQYGAEGAKKIKQAVDLCEGDYEWLKQFAMKV